MGNVLLYWKENNRYVFSRTKFLTLLVFVVSFIYGLQDWQFGTALVIALVFAVPTFIIGFFIHSIMDIDSSYYSGNAGEDIVHFLLYWHEDDRFRLSKTKLITLLIIVLGLISGLGSALPGQYSGQAFASTVVSIVIAVPAFLIGYFIHKRTSAKKPVQQHSKPVQQPVMTQESRPNQNAFNSPDYMGYALKARELKMEYNEKERQTRELINKRFTPPQITNEKFMAVVDESTKVFNEYYKSILNMINFAGKDSARIDNELTSRLDSLRAIIDKLDDLSSELIISMSKSDADEVHDVLDDMENLITSINEYKD